MPILNRDMVVVIKFVASSITAGFLIFFISALTGEDLFKNQKTIADLDTLLSEISTELEDRIDLRIKQLGEIPEVNPYRKFYCAEFAKELHEISYITEKQKIAFDTYNVRDFEQKMEEHLINFDDEMDTQEAEIEEQIKHPEGQNPQENPT